ncbi:MAG: hypothetical protein IPP47_21480 [Bryobacterales bacterium]|nr:hypothetical protein [Bryobacterales bacterium]
MDRQRILIIFGAAWISAALLTWFSGRAPARQAGKDRQVVAAIRDMAAGQKLKPGDLKTIAMPAGTCPNSHCWIRSSPRAAPALPGDGQRAALFQ